MTQKQLQRIQAKSRHNLAKVERIVADLKAEFAKVEIKEQEAKVAVASLSQWCKENGI